jgi:UMF1 family MFS transporter
LADSSGNRREVFAWAMYDWANSAYSALSITILVSYIKLLFPDEFGTRVWGWGIGLSMLAAAILSPVLGAIADAHASKRRWLALTALGGAALAVVLGIMPPNSTGFGAVALISLFFLVSLCFELSLGFYNGFLPEIADRRSLDRVSARGYALGYLGGGLALILAIIVLKNGARFGVPDLADQLRVGIVIMGLWWGLFSLPALLVLRDKQQPRARPLPLWRAASQAAREVGRTIGNVRRYRWLALFLLGFLIYNDGIQTVLSQASVFAIEVLRMEPDDLIRVVLLIQFAALPGAMFVGWLAGRIGQKPTLMGCLAVWAGLLTAAYFVTTAREFYVMAAVLALVMGGTQSVSRAIMGSMTPARHTAEFFGFFNLSGKATSMVGPIMFAEIVARTGSAHLAILSLLSFILIGWAIVAFLNLKRGQQDALAADASD